MVPKQQKVEKFYFSIGEVAQLFGLNESTLRFWEKEFDEISPRKTKKGTRYYRQEDIEQIRLIYHLVKERGMTLSGARRKLKENRETTVRILQASRGTCGFGFNDRSAEQSRKSTKRISK